MYLAFFSLAYKYYLLSFNFCFDFFGFKPEKCMIINGGTNEKYVGGATKLFKQNERINNKGKEPGLPAFMGCARGLKGPYQRNEVSFKNFAFANINQVLH